MAVIDLNESELMATFLNEAGDDIAALEAGLLALEENPEDGAIRVELLRSAHTLKGNASCVGLTSITAFAHAYEEVLERVSGGGAVDGELITLLLSGVDTFRRLLTDDTLTPADRELMERLTSGGGNSVAHAAPMQSGAAQAQSNKTLRVSLERLNRMLDLAGEISIARGRVQEALAVEGGLSVLAEVEQQIDVLQNELQELIMRARMVAVGPIFRQYARTVRDLAATHGKNARLVTIGDDVELDTSAIERLRDPISHMIRNAIDHGIEPSHVRTNAGKPPLGHITLEAKHEAGSIIIRVSDDGAGLDRRAVIARARALGLDADRLTDAEAMRLIFEPGFSTASEVTDLSGRGVGMDVVRRAIEALRGTIAIESVEGKGTTFTIRLPLTLAVIEGFGIVAGDETWIVPMEHVVECVELPQNEPEQAATGILLLRDEVVPYVRMRRLFAIGGSAPGRENVLIVQHDGRKAGLVVDFLLGGNQAVIKPLGSYFSDVPGIAGSSILGSGRVALILDTPTILRNLAERNEA